MWDFEESEEPFGIGRTQERRSNHETPRCRFGRTQTNGKADYEAVHAIQAQYKLTPLSTWGKPYTPPTNVPVDPSVKKTPPLEQVEKMDAQNFLGGSTP